MYALSNSELTVFILDPVADTARLGSRYCTGGYIWQVTDSKQGELLSGPEYPKKPNTFDGQGAPDFFIRTLGAEDAPLGGEVGVIGVGRVRRSSPVEPFDVRHNREVIEFVQWEVICAQNSVTMRTRGAFREWAYTLERVVSLERRTLHSVTSIHNTGLVLLPVRWFAHPFFPLTADGVLCRFSLPFRLDENPGYRVNAEGFVARQPEHDWSTGWYQPVDYVQDGAPLTVIQKHDRVGQVTAVTDFAPCFLPIWGNDRTFSFEPYFEREFAPGQSATWGIQYTF